MESFQAWKHDIVQLLLAQIKVESPLYHQSRDDRIEIFRMIAKIFGLEEFQVLMLNQSSLHVLKKHVLHLGILKNMAANSMIQIALHEGHANVARKELNIDPANHVIITEVLVNKGATVVEIELWIGDGYL